MAGERSQDLRGVQRSTWERIAALPHHLFLDAQGDIMLYQFLVMPEGAPRRAARSDSKRRLTEHLAIGQKLSTIWRDAFRRVGPARAAR